MGLDKVDLVVKNEPLGQRLVRLLVGQGYPTTVLGRPVAGATEHQPDPPSCTGPLYALAHFKPKAGRVFVLSCDVPLFDPRVVEVLAREMKHRQAVIPKFDDRSQPLCALYRADAFPVAKAVADQSERRVMEWLKRLEVHHFDAATLQESGIDPRSVRGANTPEEFQTLLA
jgi:molybdopterin-guanine dinucleotide biosynthesis protein A